MKATHSLSEVAAVPLAHVRPRDGLWYALRGKPGDWELVAAGSRDIALTAAEQVRDVVVGQLDLHGLFVRLEPT